MNLTFRPNLRMTGAIEPMFSKETNPKLISTQLSREVRIFCAEVEGQVAKKRRRYFTEYVRILSTNIVRK